MSPAANRKERAGVTGKGERLAGCKHGESVHEHTGNTFASESVMRLIADKRKEEDLYVCVCVCVCVGRACVLIGGNRSSEVKRG